MTRELVLAAFVLLSPSIAHADDEVDAPTLRVEKLAAEAEAKVAAGAYEQAIELYSTAYKESPAAVLLFDLAWVYDRHLHSRMEAIDLYQRALAAGDLEPRLAKLAEERLGALEARPAEPPPSVPPSPSANSAKPASKIPEIVVAGVGIAGIGTSLLLGALAKSKDDEAAAFCNGDRCTDARALSLTDDATGFATGANIAFIAGTALLIGGVVMWLVAK